MDKLGRHVRHNILSQSADLALGLPTQVCPKRRLPDRVT